MDITFLNIFVILLLSTALVKGIARPDYEDDEVTYVRCPWIRNKLKNGRVKIRSGGRVAKFLCDSGYERVGKRFASCVLGKWNNPMPHCVAKGCYKMPEPRHVKVSERNSGAVLFYECFPGYTLQGPSALYCDGYRWNDAAPICNVANNHPDLSCDFEDPDLCGWTNDPSHDFEWRRHQFATPSGQVGTGPSYDHTFGQGRAGFYLYLEASAPRMENDTCRLFSPVYLPHYSPGCFTFWYHMYGDTTGTLRVYLKLESQVFGELSPTWELTGDQGNQWLRGEIAIRDLTENFQFIVEGIRGKGYIGDIAVDDVRLWQTDCDFLPAPNVTLIEGNSCRGRCIEQIIPGSCGCTERCVITNTCCEDYVKLCTSGGYLGSSNTEGMDDFTLTTEMTEFKPTKTTEKAPFSSTSSSSTTQVATEITYLSSSLKSENIPYRNDSEINKTPDEPLYTTKIVEYSSTSKNHASSLSLPASPSTVLEDNTSSSYEKSSSKVNGITESTRLLSTHSKFYTTVEYSSSIQDSKFRSSVTSSQSTPAFTTMPITTTTSTTTKCRGPCLPITTKNPNTSTTMAAVTRAQRTTESPFSFSVTSSNRPTSLYKPSTITFTPSSTTSTTSQPTLIPTSSIPNKIFTLTTNTERIPSNSSIATKVLLTTTEQPATKIKPIKSSVLPLTLTPYVTMSSTNKHTGGRYSAKFPPIIYTTTTKTTPSTTITTSTKATTTTNAITKVKPSTINTSTKIASTLASSTSKTTLVVTTPETVTRLPQTISSTVGSKIVATEAQQAIFHQSESSKTKTLTSNASTIATLCVVSILLFIAGVSYYYFGIRKHFGKKHLDDSEIKFLSKNEVLEFCDPTE